MWKLKNTILAFCVSTLTALPWFSRNSLPNVITWNKNKISTLLQTYPHEKTICIFSWKKNIQKSHDSESMPPDSLKEKIRKALENFHFDPRTQTGVLHIEWYQDITIKDGCIWSWNTRYRIYAPRKPDEYPRIINIEVKENKRILTLEGND